MEKQNALNLIKQRVFWYNPEYPYVINQKLYEYDIKRCYTSILKKYNVIDLTNTEKLKANITIGKLIKKDRKIYDLLNNETKKILIDFINRHDIKISDIINYEKDALIITKSVWDDDKTSDLYYDNYEIALKSQYDFGVRDYKKIKSIMLIRNGGEIKTKGIIHKPIGFDEFLTECGIISRITRNDLETNIKFIKLVQKRIFDKLFPKHYIIHSGDKYYVMTNKGNEEIVWDDKYLEYASRDFFKEHNIDALKYYNIYIQPFIKSFSYLFI